MKQLENIVTNYLNDAFTDYALMIDGPWGCGKTYYWNNTLTSLIQQRQCAKGTPWRVAYISLYGLRTSEEIDRSILVALHPISQIKTAKIATSVIKLGADAILKKYTGISTGKIAAEAIEWIDTTNVVLCFDDLERCSMSITDALGYINEYVEHQHVRTIVLCNETKITDLDAYKITKEKVIGHTFKFSLDHDEIIKALIQTINKDDPFNSFLVRHQRTIADLFKRSSTDNIRLLKQAVSKLRAVHRVLKDQSAPEPLMLAYLKLIVPLSLEFGKGISAKDIQYVGSSDSSLVWAAFYGSQSKDKPDYLKSYAELYFDGMLNGLITSTPISKYIITGFLDEDALISELKKFTAPKDALTSMIHNFMNNSYELNDQEFKSIADTVLSAITDHKISDLADIYRIVSRLLYWATRDVLSQTPSALLAEVTATIHDGVEKQLYTYDALLSDSLRPTSDDQNIIELEKCVIDANKTLKAKMERQACEALLSALEQLDETAFKQFSYDFTGVALLELWSAQKAHDFYQSASNATKMELIDALKSRYHNGISTEIRKQECNEISKLIELLEKSTRDHNVRPIPMSISITNHFIDVLTNAIDRFTEEPS